MLSSFDYYRQIESPEMYLANPDRKKICDITGKDRHLVLRFNDLSELTFNVPKIKCTEKFYNLIETKRLVFVENIGWFQITNVTETIEADYLTKSVTTESHQTALKSRGFYTEERIYMFYNPDDPTDSNYRSEEKSHIPSVVGQLYQQLGIKTILNGSSEADYDDWTIIEIDDILKYISKSYLSYDSGSDNNICRSFKENTTYGYDFIINDASAAFEVVFDFDILHHTISIKTIDSVTVPTNIYLSFSNVINSMTIEENAEDIVTVLSCRGGNLDIIAANPMGTDYIVNFDYYKKTKSYDGKIDYPWMSNNLINTLNNWETEWKNWKNDENKKETIINGVEKSLTYSQLIEELQKEYVRESDIDIDIQYANLKLKDLQTARDNRKYSAKTIPIIVTETVKIGEKSKLNISKFNSINFEDTSNITVYISQPDCENKIDDGNEDNPVKWHSEFTFTGKSYTGTPKEILYSVKQNEEDIEKGLYFTDTVIGYPKTKNSYCKLNVSTEVQTFKNGNNFPSSTGEVTINGEKFYFDGNYIKDSDGNVIDIVTSSTTHTFIYDNTYYTITKRSNDITSISYDYASGYDRFIPDSEAVGDDGWYEIWNKHLKNNLRPQKLNTQENIKNVQSVLNEITELCNLKNYILKCENGEELYNELEKYWIEGEYKNDNLAVLDSTTMSEQISLAKELLTAGEKELSKVSQPTIQISVDSINFVDMIEFMKFTQELSLGRTIRIEKTEDIIFKPALLSIEKDLDVAGEGGFVLTFSNASKLDETAMTYADLLNESVSTSRTISANWSDLTDFSKNKESIINLIEQPLNLTLRATQENMFDQEFIVDDTGILGRKYSDDSRTLFDREQLRIINNSILFTNDNWESASLALGKIKYGNNQEAYGLIADVLIGTLFIGEGLKIQNKTNTITLSEDGIIIKDNKSNCVFKASTNGDLELTGNVTATKGKIGNITINEDGSIVSDNNAFKVDAAGNVSVTSGYIGNWEITNGSLIGYSELDDGYYGVAIDTKASSFETIGSEVHNGAGFRVFAIGKIADKNQSLTENWGQAGFRVHANGKLVAVGADITGHINANSGNIGDLKIDAGGLTHGSVFINANGIEISGNNGHISIGQTLLKYDSNNNISTIEAKNEFEISACENIKLIFNHADGSEYKQSFSLSAYKYQEYTNILEVCYRIKVKLSSSTITSATSSSDILTIKGYIDSDLKETKTLPVSLDNSGEEKVYNVLFTCGLFEKHVNKIEITSESSSSILTATYGEDGKDGDVSKIDNFWYFTKQLPLNNIICQGNFVPRVSSDDYASPYTLGLPTALWKDIYAESGAINISDKNKKQNIQLLSNEYSLLFDKLEPVSFKFIQNESDRTHTGFIAQQVKECIESAGLTTQEFAGYCEWNEGEEVIGCGLRYSEFIALCVDQIQKLKKRVKELENK